MQQRHHLLTVNRERRSALAARFGTRWLLPSITCDERVRAGPLVVQWCAERGLAGDVAGQWLGRVDATGVDWLIAISARTPLPQVVTPLEWIDLDLLSNGPSVIDYQSWALARSLIGHAIPTVAGPFGNLDWPERARAWIAASLGSPPCAWTPYRTSAYEVVLGVETARGRVYLKGLTRERADEAELTRSLAALAPESFAPTLTLEYGADGTVWWLTGGCAGRPTRDAALVGAALARLQQRLMACADDLPGLRDMDLDAAVVWACAGTHHADLIRDTYASVQRASLPRAWLPMDLDPTNVIVHDGDVRFIDVDDSYVGPAPLPIALFARRCGGPPAHRAYQQSWSPPLERIDWQSFEIAAAVFEAWRGWERVRRNVERGEVDAPLDRLETRVRERLARAFYCR
jgi:hypothetical protein